ncbi:MAG TPA: glycosyltransferase [Pedobacter sp.]|uniref:glycosyltransferase n=1 Tax=Pedobacter sp. TaxID=1411316 RepID=UPI002CC94D50|nr:glycosyltransferase [Pedobacter sp.]HMI00859.1 glycosyltransferase [Pedobacter sp.]
MQEYIYSHVLPIVVLYRQTIEESSTLLSLNASLALLNLKMDLFIYDNSPEANVSDNHFSWRQFRVHYSHDPTNGGLSKAYNEGAKKAVQMNKKWLLLLDQDTSFAKTILSSYQVAVDNNPRVRLFAPILELSNGIIFSPCINKHKRGYPAKEISSGLHSLSKLSPVNSGILVDLNLFLEVGGYNENLKVDFCDFQFLEKIQKKESDFYVVDSVASQDFSSDEVSLQKQRHRFEIYLKDAINCEKTSLKDKLEFLYTVTRHTLGLTYKQKSLVFIKIYFLKYLTC